MNRPLPYVHLFCIWLLCSMSTVTAADKQSSPLPIEEMRATAYTKAFAKRFALPEPQPGTEPEGGIQAMEFAVETNPNAPYYYCKLYLYFDNKLPIAYPEGETGIQHLPSRRTQLMTFDARTRWLALSEKDRLHFNERAGRYRRSAALASSNYEWHKQGLFADMFYEEYHTNLFPGLAYLKIDMACPTAQWGERYPSLEVWLKKKGAPDYRHQTRINSDDFLRFPVPNAFFKTIHGWIKSVAHYNESVIREQPKEQRERSPALNDNPNR